MKPIEHRIKRMIERIEIAERPNATEAQELIESAYLEGHISGETAAKWSNIASDAVRLQQRRLMQRDYLIHSGAVKC